jgi:hypothetical protein
MQLSELLSEKNKHPRDAGIVFDEEPHIYTILDDPQSEYTSVTTWNHSHFAEFDADKIIDKMMSNKERWKKSKYYPKTKEQIKAEWEAAGKEASELGTRMHKAIELYYNIQNDKPHNGNDKLQSDEQQGDEPQNDEQQSTEFRYFLEFARDFKHLRPYRTEWMIYDTELKFAGSVDMLFENPDGTLEIYDWKRSKEIKMDNPWQSSHTPCIQHLPDCNYVHYCLQLNTYREMLERNYQVKIGGMYLVILHPTQTTYQRIKVQDLREEIRDLFAYRKQILQKQKMNDDENNGENENENENDGKNEEKWMGTNDESE